MRTRVLAIAIAAGLILSGTACSSDTPGPAAGSTTGAATTTPGGQDGTPDPCDLLTLAEISAELGEEYTVAEELPAGGMPGQRTCNYTKGPDSISTVGVAVWPFDPADVDSFILELGEINQYDGLGDRSFGETNSLWVMAGNIMLNITFSFIEVENIDPINQLGLKAVARL